MVGAVVHCVVEGERHGVDKHCGVVEYEVRNVCKAGVLMATVVSVSYLIPVTWNFRWSFSSTEPLCPPEYFSKMTVPLYSTVRALS